MTQSNATQQFTPVATQQYKYPALPGASLYATTLAEHGGDKAAMDESTIGPRSEISRDNTFESLASYVARINRRRATLPESAEALKEIKDRQIQPSRPLVRTYTHEGSDGLPVLS